MTLRLDQHLPEPGGPEAGPPLLFVHGAWHGAWVWRNFLPWFAERGYRAYAIDLRGHGQRRDRAVLRRARIADYVEDVEAAVAAVGEPPPVLVGHSMGGLVVQRYLEGRDGEGAAGQGGVPLAVLCASVPPHGALGSTLRGSSRHLLAAGKVLVTLDLRHFLATDGLARDLLFSDSTPEETVQRARLQVGPESWRAFLDMLFFGLPDPSRVRTPVAVVAAIEDGLFTHRDAHRTAHAYRHVLVREGPDPVPTFVPGGHDLMLDIGWEKAAQAVLAAVRRVVR